MGNSKSRWEPRIRNTPAGVTAMVVNVHPDGWEQVDRVFGCRTYASVKSAERFAKRYIAKNR